MTLAVILHLPALTPVTVPLDTVAIDVSLDVHVIVGLSPAPVVVAVIVIVLLTANDPGPLIVIVGTVPDPITKTIAFSSRSIMLIVSTL